MKRVGAIILSALVIAGCTTTSAYRAGGTTVTPDRGQTAQQQAADTSACEQVARNQTNRGTETAKGAGVGAGVGAVGGAATGGRYKYAKSGDAYNANVASCMSARGYSVTY